MNRILDSVFILCIAAVLAECSLSQVHQEVTGSKSTDEVDKQHNWDSFRLGRGLQMLRLGKRSVDAEPDVFGRWSRTVEADENRRLSNNDIQALLDSIFDEPRDESRRQPPLPRYGRDSGSYGTVFRPAPRAGRYRRSAEASWEDAHLLDEFDQ